MVDYVASLSRRHVTRRKMIDGEVQERTHFEVQHIRCTNRQEAERIAAALHDISPDLYSEPAVRVWNGKGSSVVSIDTILQIYSEMEHDTRPKPKAV